MPNRDLSSGHDTFVLEAADCHNLTIRDLSVHVSFLTLANAQVQTHAIVLGQDCDGVTVRNVRVFQSPGDGIRIIGKSRALRNVSIESCSLVQTSGPGWRCSATSRGWRCEVVTSNLEPSGSGAPTDVLFTSNVIVQKTSAVAVSLSGISGADRAMRVEFTDNILLDGGIFCTGGMTTRRADPLLVRIGARRPRRVARP